jgi:hypothetical protein
MKATIYPFCFMILISAGEAYSQQEELIRVRTGQGPSILKSFPKDKRFRFDSFREGQIYNSERKIWPVNLINYDFLLGDMLSVDPKGDTLLINDVLEFKYFVIDKITFIHVGGKGYFEVIRDKDSLKLCVREVYTMKRRERHLNNGYGDFNDQTSAYTSTKSVGAAASSQSYDLNGDVLLHKRGYLFIVDRNSEFHRATKTNFINLFPRLKSEINAFIKSNHTNFQSRKSVAELFDFCTHHVK